MPARLAQLVGVRSQMAEALHHYYRAVIERLDRTPWFRGGEAVRASRIAVPARVLKEDTRPGPERPGHRPGEDERGDRAERPLMDPEIAALYEEPTRQKRQEEVPWTRERLRLRRAIVLGAPGGGKSFFTDMTAVEIARDALRQLDEHRAAIDVLPVPIHVELAALAARDLPRDPADALLAVLAQTLAPWPRLLEHIRPRLRTETAWLILDALDQVEEADRSHLRARLAAIGAQQWRCRVILTCRVANYDRAFIPWATLTEYDLAPFDPREVRRFIDRWFGPIDARGQALRQAVEASFALRNACRNPLIATLACLAHEEIPVTEDTRRVDLYARVLRGLARRACVVLPGMMARCWS